MERNAMRLRGDWYCYDEDPGGGSEEGGWAFLLPLARHHLVILSTAYRLLFPTPALTAPLIVWTVEGYLTMCLISLRGRRQNGNLGEVNELTAFNRQRQVGPGRKLRPVLGGFLSVVWWRSNSLQ